MILGERFHLSLIGPFGLSKAGGSSIQISSRKSMALIAMLATGDNGRRARLWLQDQLWGMSGTQRSQASLRRELSNLRKSLEGHRASHIIDVTAVQVSLDLEIVSVDFLNTLGGQLDHKLLLGTQFLEGLDIPGEEGFEDWLRLCRAKLDDIRDDTETIGIALESQRNSAATQLPSFKTRLAVLPFSHLSSDSKGEALVDSLVEETAHVLSRYATLHVIDPGTSLSYKDKQEQAEFIDETKLRYFVNGNLRQDGDRVKITIGLTDCATRLKVWSGKFEGDLTNFFDLPENIASALAPQIDGNIDRHEQMTARTHPVKNPDAYSLYWQANALFREWQPNSIAEAISMTDQVLRLETDNSWAMSLGSFCRALLTVYQWSDAPENDRKEAYKGALKASETSPNEPIVLGYAAGTLALLGRDIDIAEMLIKRALEMEHPTSGMFFWGAWIDLIKRDFSAALEKFEICLETNPNSAVRPFMLAGIAIAQMANRDPLAAERNAQEALALLPDQPIILAAAGAAKLANGKNDEAISIARTLKNTGGMDVFTPLLKSDAEKEMLAALIDRTSNGKPPDLKGMFGTAVH